MAVWSKVPFSKLSSDLRIDAEFYRPEHLQLDKILSEKEAPPWGNTKGSFIVGPFGSAFLVENYVDRSPYRYIRGRDVKPFFLQDDENCYMAEEHFRGLAKYALREGDLLVSVVGTLGNVSIVTEDIGLAVFSCKSTAFRSSSCDPYYLCAYLNSTIGQTYLQRMVRGHVQTGLNLDDLKSIPIFLPSKNLEEAVSRAVQMAYSKRIESKTLYARAESLLLDELGLNDLDISHTLFYERRFSEVRQAVRFDAEYFQPRFQKAFYLLGNQKRTVGDVAKLAKRRFVPKRGESFRYIEIGDVSDCGSIESQEIPGEDAPSRAAWIVRPGDVITSTVRPIRRSSALIELDQSDFVCSSGFAALTPQTVPSELLLVYLRLPIIAEILDLHCSASMYPAISTGDLMRIPFCKPSDAVVGEIKTMVARSRAARTESRRLLDEAKRMVEKVVLES